MGFGSQDNKEYYKLMAEYGLMYGKNKKTVLAVHNGYLDIGLMHGIPAMIVFCWLFISMLLYFKRRIIFDRPETSYPYYAILIFLIGHVTQPFAGFRIYYVLLVAIVCGSFVSVYSDKRETRMSQRY